LKKSEILQLGKTALLESSKMRTCKTAPVEPQQVKMKLVEKLARMVFAVPRKQQLFRLCQKSVTTL
jgi:hypothetical protein